MAEGDESPEVSDEAERAFLSLSWWLAHTGWRTVAAQARTATERALNGVSLKTHLSFADLVALLASSADFAVDLLPALLPTTQEDLARLLAASGLPAGLERDAGLQMHLAEARAWLRGADVRLVLPALIGRARGALDAALAQELLFRPADDEAESEEEVRKQRLAGMLPSVARWCHTAVHGYPSALIDAVAGAPEMTKLCAVVFASWGAEYVPCGTA